jgi:hypothetical protein
MKVKEIKGSIDIGEIRGWKLMLYTCSRSTKGHFLYGRS